MQNRDRKFGGDTFSLQTTVLYKGMAREVAARLRRTENKKARVVRVPSGYSVYARRRG